MCAGPYTSLELYEKLCKFDLLKIFCMDLYTISAGENRMAQFKQNLESGEFDLTELHCNIIYTSTCDCLHYHQ